MKGACLPVNIYVYKYFNANGLNKLFRPLKFSPMNHLFCSVLCSSVVTIRLVCESTSVSTFSHILAQLFLLYT